MKHTRKGWWWKAPVLVFSALVVLVSIVLALGLSNFGLNKLRPHAVAFINQRIRGHVSIASIQRVGMRVSLTGVVVNDLEGRPAAVINAVVVQPALGSLLHGEIVLQMVTVTQPKLNLHADANGLNISQAFTLRSPSPPTPPAKASKPQHFVLNQVRIDDGELRYQANQEAPIEVRGLRLRGAADARWPGGPVSLALYTHAHVGQPVDASWDIKLLLKPKSGSLHEMQLAGSLGDSGLGLQGTVDLDVAHPSVDVNLLRAELSPSMGRALVPASPLVTPLNVTGNVTAKLDPQTQGEGRATLKLATFGGAAFLTVQGGTYPVPHITAQLTSETLDLQKIARGAAPSQLRLALSCDVKGTRLGKLSGHLEASLPPGSIAGMATGPVQIAANLNEDKATLQRFHIELPGLTVNASAQLAGLGTLLPQAHLEVAANVLSLQKLSRVVAATGSSRLDVEGAGQVHVKVNGNPILAQGQVEARFGSVRVGTFGVQGVTAKLAVPSLRALWTPTLRVVANRITFGQQTLSNVTINTSSPATDRLVVSVSSDGPVAASLYSTMRWKQPGQQLVLEKFSVTYPQTRWQSEGPSEISLSSVVRLRNFSIHADEQRLLANVSLNQQFVDAQVKLTRLDLRRLGSILAKSSPATGQLSLQLDARGPLAHPAGKVSVHLQNASFGTYGPVAGDLLIRHTAGRAQGSLDITAADGIVAGTFDVPAVWPWPAHASAEVQFKASVPSLTAASTRLGIEPKARPRGTIAIDLQLDKQAQRTTLALALNATHLGFQSSELGDLKALVQDNGLSPLHGSLQWMRTNFAKRIELDVETQLHMGQLLRETPKIMVAGLKVQPTRVKATVAGLDVAKASNMAMKLAPSTLGAKLKGQELAGQIDLNIDFKGTLAAMQGSLDLNVTGGRVRKSPATDATLAVSLSPTVVTADARVFQRGRNDQRIRLLTLAGRLNVPTTDRTNLQLWRRMPFDLVADVGTLSFQHQTVAPDILGNLRGDLQAHLQAKGVLDHPTVALDVLFKSLKTADAKIGDARLHFAFENDVASSELSIASAVGGSLQLRAHTKEPLPWQSIMAPAFKPSLVPLHLTFLSQSFELAAFDGAFRAIRELKGTLDSTLAFEGTLDKPIFSGELGLRRGTLDIVEVGRVFDMRMDVWANENMLKLDALRCKSGAGDGVVKFEAKRTVERGFALSGDFDFARFPLQSPQRKLGELSVRANAKGKVNTDGIVIDPLTIQEAKAFLQGATPKDLQDLDRPDDVVFVRNGEPVDKAEAKKIEKLRHPTIATDHQAVEAEASPSLPSSLPVTLHVRAPRNIWVYAPEGSIEMGLSEDFQLIIDGDTKIFGTVNLRRGRLSVLGRRFDIQDGSNIRFTGPQDQPMLDISVAHFSETAQVRVFVTASGTPKDLQLKFRSEPELDQSAILTLLVTGRINPVQGGGVAPDRAEQAASIVGGLLAAKLQQTVLRQLPIDVLSISAAAIEAGTYITSNLYVGYVRRLAAIPWRYENVNAVHLEYQINEGWSFEGEYGDAGSGSGDLVWKNRY